jgi:hypothetical protein
MYCKSAIVLFCKPTVTLWELCTNLTKQIYRNVYCAMVLVQLLMWQAGKEYVEKYCVVINVKSDVANVNDCKPSNFQNN